MFTESEFYAFATASPVPHSSRVTFVLFVMVGLPRWGFWRWLDADIKV